MKRGERVWRRGLIAALISGAANAVTGSSFATMLAPESFNFDEGLLKLVALFAFTLVAGGILGTANYLKQSPLPPDDELDVKLEIKARGP